MIKIKEKVLYQNFAFCTEKHLTFSKTRGKLKVLVFYARTHLLYQNTCLDETFKITLKQ